VPLCSSAASSVEGFAISARLSPIVSAGWSINSASTKAWAKREAHVSAMIESTVGMVGDLHGIMGQAMPEISAIDDPPMIEGKPLKD
jgi:hypothetical protein